MPHNEAVVFMCTHSRISVTLSFLWKHFRCLAIQWWAIFQFYEDYIVILLSSLGSQCNVAASFLPVTPVYTSYAHYSVSDICHMVIWSLLSKQNKIQYFYHNRKIHSEIRISQTPVYIWFVFLKQNDTISTAQNYFIWMLPQINKHKQT